MPNRGWSIAPTLLLLISSSAFSSLTFATQAGGAATTGAESTLLTTIPENYVAPPGGWMPRCSADRTVCAYLAQKGSDAFVVTNGTPGSPYEEVRDVVFSEDGRHVAYAAKRKASWMVVADGHEGPTFDKIENLMYRGSVPIYVGYRPPAPRLEAGNFGGSSDIAGFRSSRKAGVQAVMMVGDREDEIPVVEDRFLGIRDLTVSPDGKTYAYIVQVSAGPYGLWLLMVNGQEVAEDHGIRMFSFLKDGRLVFARRSGSPVNGASKVQFGTEETSERSEEVIGDIVAGAVSPDGRKVVYAVCTGKAEEGHCALRLNEKVVREGAVDNPALSPNGLTLAYTERQASGQVRAIVGGQAGPLVDGVVGKIIFSADSRRHAYRAKLGAKTVVVADAVVGPSFDSVDGVRFSADSKHLVYAATNDGARRIVVDQVAGPATYAWVTDPEFNAAGTAVRFVAQEGKTFLRRSVAVRRQ